MLKKPELSVPQKFSGRFSVDYEEEVDSNNLDEVTQIKAIYFTRNLSN
jgi:hypothetical protein